MNRSFLLITNDTMSPGWVELLRKVLTPFGELEIQNSQNIEPSPEKNYLKGIIVDAGIEEDPALLTSRLKIQYPDVPVVIFTSALTWKQMREALLAGAADYLRKEMDDAEFREALIKDFNLRPHG